MKIKALPFIFGLMLMTPFYLFSAGGKVKGPNEIAPNRYVYYPGTEVLAEDEIRVIACGTGMPDQRMGQASACFLMELGNGDKFIFDVGTGSMFNVIYYDAERDHGDEKGWIAQTRVQFNW